MDNAIVALFVLASRTWCTVRDFGLRVACLAGIPLAFGVLFVFLDGIVHEYLVRRRWKTRTLTDRERSSGRHAALALSITLKAGAIFALFVTVVLVAHIPYGDCCSLYTVSILLRTGLFTSIFLIGFWTSAATNDIWESRAKDDGAAETLPLKKMEYTVIHAIVGALAVLFCTFAF